MEIQHEDKTYASMKCKTGDLRPACLQNLLTSQQSSSNACNNERRLGLYQLYYNYYRLTTYRYLEARRPIWEGEAVWAYNFKIILKLES